MATRKDTDGLAALEGLMRSRRFRALADGARAGLRKGKLPRPALLNALAVALVGQVVDAAPDAAPVDAGALLSEAIDLLEALVYAGPDACSAAAAFDNVGWNLAAAWCAARDGQWPLRLARPDDPLGAGRELLAQARHLLEANHAAGAAALTKRAHMFFEAVLPEARACERAATHVARLLCACAGDKPGAAIPVERTALEQARDHERLSAYSAEEEATYLDILARFHGAASNSLQLELAGRLLAEALDVYRAQARRTGDADSLAVVLGTIGETALDSGRIGAAVLAFDELDRLCRSGACAAPYARRCLAGLGQAWAALGEPERGVQACRAFIASAVEFGLPPIAPFGQAVRFFALALDTGRFELASDIHGLLAATGDAHGTSAREIAARRAETTAPRDAIDAYRTVLAGPHLASTLRRIAPRLARLLMAQGELDDARGLAMDALEVFDNTGRRETEGSAELLEIVAIVDAARGDAATAVDLLFSATALDNRIAPQRLGCALSSRRPALLAGARRRFEALLGLVVAHFSDRGEWIGGAHAIGLRRKGVNTAIEWEKAQRIAAASGEDPDLDRLRRRQAELRSLRAAGALARARGRAGCCAVPGDVRDGEEDDEVDRELTCRIGGARMAGLIDAANPMSVAMGIPEESAFVDLFLHTPIAGPDGRAPAARYCAFVTTARSIEWRVVDLGAAHKIDRLVRRWRLEVTGEQPAGQRFATALDRHIGARLAPPAMSTGRLSAGARLRRRVIEPLRRSGVPRRLVVSADGALRSVPLECLPGTSGASVIDEFIISYASSARSLAYFNLQANPMLAPGAGAPLVVGDPDYGVPDGALVFAGLPGSRREAGDVARLVGAGALVGDAATKAAVHAARGPRILHLATHGYTLAAADLPPDRRARPLLRVGLAFAGANSAAMAGAGLLTGEEVLSMDLGGTALTVLSACETGLGEPEHGEGLASLGRAFEIAGSEVVIVGLWRVPDEATHTLMVAFYQRLRAGDSCAQALHAAKIQLRNQQPAVADWGAFICLGRC